MTWLLAVIALTITPWSGSNYATADIASVRYRLVVTGAPGASIRLRADGIASGWIAAFCTPRLCSPQRVDATLPSSGKAVYAFELFRENGSAPKHSGAVIRSDDGASIRVP